MEAYSKEFGRDVVAACDSGEGTRVVATCFGVSKSWVRRFKRDRRRYTLQTLEAFQPLIAFPEFESHGSGG